MKETQDQDAATKELPLEWSTIKERQNIKTRLMSASRDKLSEKESAVLNKIFEDEKLENAMGAARHKLVERADKWGRKKIEKIVSDVAGEVGGFTRSEKLLLAEANTEYEKRCQSVRARANDEMKKIQQKLSSDINTLTKDRDAAIEKVRNQFQPKYAQAEQKMNTLRDGITKQVGRFSEDIQLLPLNKLEKLIAGEKVTHVTPDGARTLNLVCPDLDV